MPGSRFTTLKPPLSSVVAKASLLVPLFLAVTVAPATTSLLGFTTVPLIAPVVVDWAITLSAHDAKINRLTKKARSILDIDLLLFLLVKRVFRGRARATQSPMLNPGEINLNLGSVSGFRRQSKNRRKFFE